MCKLNHYLIRERAKCSVQTTLLFRQGQSQGSRVLEGIFYLWVPHQLFHTAGLEDPIQNKLSVSQNSASPVCWKYKRMHGAVPVLWKLKLTEYTHSRPRQHRPIFPTLWRLRQEDCYEFKVSLATQVPVQDKCRDNAESYNAHWLIAEGPQSAWDQHQVARREAILGQSGEMAPESHPERMTFSG